MENFSNIHWIIEKEVEELFKIVDYFFENWKNFKQNNWKHPKWDN